MRKSRKFCQRGSNFDNVFFFSVDEGKGGSKYQPFSACHYWPASERPFKWPFAGGPIMAQN